MSGVVGQYVVLYPNTTILSRSKIEIILKTHIINIDKELFKISRLLIEFPADINIFDGEFNI